MFKVKTAQILEVNKQLTRKFNQVICLTNVDWAAIILTILNAPSHPLSDVILRCPNKY